MFHFEIELHLKASLRVQNIFMVAELGLTQASRHGVLVLCKAKFVWSLLTLSCWFRIQGPVACSSRGRPDEPLRA